MPTGYEGVVYAKANTSLRKALAECAHNALYGEINFTDEERQVLRSHIGDLTLLSQRKKIKPDLLSKVLAPIIAYVCESAANSDVRDVRKHHADGSSESSTENPGEIEADPGH